MPSQIRGRVIYLHPVHNFALIEYDMSSLSRAASAAVTSATLAPSPPLQKGDSVHLIGLSASMRPTSRTSIVTDAHHALSIPPADVPRYRATKEEVIELDMDFGSNFSGVLTDSEGRVRALWASYSKQVAKDDDREFVRGLPTEVFAPAVEAAFRAIVARSKRKVEQQRLLNDLQSAPSTSAVGSGAGAGGASPSKAAAAMPPPQQSPKANGGGRKRARESDGDAAEGAAGLSARDADTATFLAEWETLLDVEIEPLLLTKAAGCGLSQARRGALSRLFVCLRSVLAPLLSLR